MESLKNVFLTALLVVLVCSAYGNEATFGEFEIKLKSGHFTPPEEISLESVVSGAEGERIHVLIQFNSIPNSSTKNALKSAGIRLLNYIPKNTWFASIPLNLSPDNPALSSTRWIGKILSEDKIAPGIQEQILGIAGVDFKDLLESASQWLSVGEANLDGVEEVNMADFAPLAKNWKVVESHLANIDLVIKYFSDVNIEVIREDSINVAGIPAGSAQ